MHGFTDYFASVCQNGCFIGIHMGLCAFCAVEKQREIGIFILDEVFLQHFFTVIFLFPIGVFHRKGIVQSYLAACREIVRIFIFFITNLLNGWVLCGIDTQAAAVKGCVSLGFCIAPLFLQIPYYLFGEFINEITVCFICFFLCLFYILNPLIDVVGQTFVILCFGDVFLLQHVVQNIFSSLSIFLRIYHRIELGGVLTDSGNNRTFGKCQITDIFAEITLCGSLYTVVSVSEVDGIQIIFQNNVFVFYLFFQLNGQILFLKFTLEALYHGLVGPACENIVFQKLLGNGTGAFCKVSAVGNTFNPGAENASYINTIVFIETFVFNSHHRML